MDKANNTVRITDLEDESASQIEDEPCCSMHTVRNEDISSGPVEESEVSGSDCESEDEIASEKKPVNPYELFANQVTIAGLTEAYDHYIQAVLIMFRVSMVGFFAFAIYESIQIARQYINDEDVFLSFKNIHDVPPFPNISICNPYFFNHTQCKTTIAAFMDTNAKAERLEKLFNFTIDEVTNYVKLSFAGKNEKASISSPMCTMAQQIFDDASRKFVEENRTIFEIWIPECKSVLSDCAMDNQPFDCCHAATKIAASYIFCNQISWSKIEASQMDNRSKSDRSELSVTVSTDWNYGLLDNDDNAGSDGFKIFVDGLPHLFAVPIAVPAFMDVSIIINQPAKMKQITDCISDDKIPKLSHYNYYDSQGLNCVWDRSLGLGMNMAGCEMPTLSYFSVEHTCPFSAISVGGITISDTGDMQALVGPLMDNKTLNKLKDDFMNQKEQFTSVFDKKKSPCIPLCSRWEYPILSVSYNSITYMNGSDAGDQQQFNNRSWSRLKFILPNLLSVSYTEHRKISAAYLAMCDIGGVMGVYLGFSMITFIQVIVFGMNIIFKEMEKRRTAVPG